VPGHPKLYRLLLASASGYASTYKELVETTDWSKYGRGRDPRCANCMAHCGYEPTAIVATASSLRESLRATRETVAGQLGRHRAPVA